MQRRLWAAVTWLPVIVFVSWSARYAFLEGYLYPQLRGGFSGDFNAVVTDRGFWDGVTPYYGPLFVVEYKTMFEPDRISLDVIGYFNYGLYAIGLACVFAALCRRCDPRVALIVFGVWLSHRATAFAFSTNAHLEILELTLIGLGLLLSTLRRPGPSGAALGVAATAKLIPAVFLVYFIVLRRWRAAFAGIAIALVVFIASVIALQISLVEGVTGFLGQHGTTSYVLGSPGNTYFVGTTAAISRLLYGPVDPVTPEQSRTTAIVFLIFSGVMAVLTAGVLLRRRARDDGLIFGLIGTLMLLITPIAHVSYHILMLPATTAVAVFLQRCEISLRAALLWSGLVTAVVLDGFPQVGRVARIVGIDVEGNWDGLNLATWGLLVLFAILALLILKPDLATRDDAVELGQGPGAARLGAA